MKSSSAHSWWVPIALAAGLSFLATLYSTYGEHDRDLVKRVSAVEAHQEEAQDRLDRIEAKLDRLLWFLGAR